jgi:hypothetical protein
MLWRLIFCEFTIKNCKDVPVCLSVHPFCSPICNNVKTAERIFITNETFYSQYTFPVSLNSL